MVFLVVAKFGSLSSSLAMVGQEKTVSAFWGTHFTPGLLCKADSKVSIVPPSNAIRSSSLVGNTSRELSIGSDPAALLQKLRSSKVFGVCTGILDGKYIAEAITGPF